MILFFISEGRHYNLFRGHSACMRSIYINVCCNKLIDFVSYAMGVYKPNLKKKMAKFRNSPEVDGGGLFSVSW